MKINLISRWWKGIAAIVFFALFPGFFFYETLAGLDYIPPIFGGLFGWLSVIVFPILLINYIYNIAKYKKSWNAINIIFFLILTYSVIVSIIGFIYGRFALGHREMLVWSLSGVLFNINMYILANSVPLESKKFVKYIYYSLFLMCFIALLNVGDTGSFYLQENSANKEAIATYQGFARSIAVIALVSIALANGFLMFAVAVFIGVLALFLNGARTEFVCFFVAVIVLAFARFGILKTLSLGTAFMVLVVLGGYGLTVTEYEKFVGNNRNLQLFDLGNATSAQARHHLNEFAIRTIFENPILGDYASYLSISKISGIGSYAHNILSAWVNLGIIGFIGYVVIALLMIFAIVKNWKKIKKGSAVWNLMIAFSSFSIVAMIFSATYSYMVFGLAVGFFARAISHRNIDAAMISHTSLR